MRAAVKEGSGPGRVSVCTVPDPTPGPGELVIQVRYAGLCHTDVSMLDWNGAAAAYTPTFPLVMGHEYTGIVVAHGPGVTGPPVGSRVVGSAQVTCGTCRYCTRGRSMLCTTMAVLGLDVAGVYAEYAKVPARNVVTLPPQTPDEVAALAEPYAVAAHAVRVGAPEPEESVAVVGPGPVGLCVTAAARFAGVTHMVVFGMPGDVSQLRLAERLGATDTVGDPDIEQHYGRFDLVVEAAGHPSAVAAALRLCRRGGRVVSLGMPDQPLTFDTGDLVRREHSLVGSRAYDVGDWPGLPEQLAAAPELVELVTHVVGLEDVITAAQLVARREATKVLIDPTVPEHDGGKTR